VTARRPSPARRRFGQHFLEPVWVVKVQRAIDPRPSDVFLEIGAGRGALTRPLAAAARHVVAFEIDRDLAEALRVARLANVSVVEGDVLDATAADVRAALAAAGIDSPVLRAAGNLPYNVASPILFKLIELVDAGLPIRDAVLMIQREVADRLLARPGSREYGVLGILVRHRARVERLLDLPPGAFRPVPKVRSTLLRMRFHPPDPPVADPAVFAALTVALFTRRRKTLANALRAYGPAAAGASPAELLSRAGLDGRRRPETLEIAEVARLASACVA
jgi:16S rRNA (adenine1518-N6/adenine1519-N6)-dimethyltransferase